MNRLRIRYKIAPKQKMLFCFFGLGLCLYAASAVSALENDDIKQLIQQLKADRRGPYQAIRWFCPDGTILPPRKRCPQPGGIQHALHKDVVQKLAKKQSIYLGQILAGTPFENFLDRTDGYSRMKQYQVEKYLKFIDNGWIMRRAQYYRGAVQSEDEEKWGKYFLKWLLSDENIRSNFFLTRQIAKDIPRRAQNEAQDERWQRIRYLALAISDQYPPFMNLRIKLHGHPEKQDLLRVKQFISDHQRDMPESVRNLSQNLVMELEDAFQPVQYGFLSHYLDQMPEASPVKFRLEKLLKNEKGLRDQVSRKTVEMTQLLWEIRMNLMAPHSSDTRLAMINLSNDLEKLLFLETISWKPDTVGKLLDKTYILAKALSACGFLEIWEWESISPHLMMKHNLQCISLSDYIKKIESARRVAEWGAGMVRTHYSPLIQMMSEFEPLVAGFTDDRIHSSLLPSLGETVGKLASLVNRFTGHKNQVFNIPDQHRIHGINPGIAVGDLAIASYYMAPESYHSNRIYVFAQPPADLNPVAGIVSVSEGNLVSHVQLLARNLGIPNGVISEQNLKDLMPYQGQRVFYAVSPQGSVLMKLAAEMTPEEQQLIAVQKKQETRIAIPTEKIQLDQSQPIGLNRIRAFDSGSICGPKAANLGELKHQFPDEVINGIVLPFGVFRQHLNQQMQNMPELNTTYWDFLQDGFARAERKRKEGKNEKLIEEEILSHLSQLRTAIQHMPLFPEFRKQLKDAFIRELDTTMGSIPVFIRSDTNMEDLKDFTGAGLNLTVFNVLEEEKIFQGIRDVWASPFSERSYQWRQKYLLNPENVYPSILILPSVNVDKSGVMITAGLSTGNAEDTTVAFSRGVGGAVEGQMAETYVLGMEGKVTLLSPSRETTHTILPQIGGVKKQYAYFNEPILTGPDLKMLSNLSRVIQARMPETPGIESHGPFDVELGFMGDKIYLFQIRPFVESGTHPTTYLKRLNPNIPDLAMVSLIIPFEKDRNSIP